jgi:hypothetical protein
MIQTPSVPSPISPSRKQQQFGGQTDLASALGFEVKFIHLQLLHSYVSF